MKILAFAILLGSLAASGNLREWESAKGGHKVQAVFLSKSGDDVKLKGEEGKIITLKLEKLSKHDQEVVLLMDTLQQEKHDAAKEIEQLEKKVKRLESKILRQESEIKQMVEKIDKRPSKQNPTAKQKPAEESPAGNGFFYKNVSMSSQLGTAGVIGEMGNRSGRDYQLANFVISVYDENGSLLATGYTNISTFSNGNTKSFQAFFPGVAVNQIKKYKIQFENGL